MNKDDNFVNELYLAAKEKNIDCEDISLTTKYSQLRYTQSIRIKEEYIVDFLKKMFDI